MPRVAELKDQVDRIWYASFHSNLTDTLTQQLRQHALLGVRAALEAALSEELTSYHAILRAAASAAGRSPSSLRRAGSHPRRVLTSDGLIPDLHVPKLRSGNAERPWQILTRYQLAMQPVLELALYLYTLGLSIRDLQEALDLSFGHVLSREAVNRVTIAAQSPLQVWRSREISHTPPILIVDGVWVQILAPTGQTWTDRGGHERVQMRGQERVVLAVMAVCEDGRHQILHSEATDAESSVSGRPSWRHSSAAVSIQMRCAWWSVMARPAYRPRSRSNCPAPSSNAVPSIKSVVSLDSSAIALFR